MKKLLALVTTIFGIQPEKNLKQKSFKQSGMPITRFFIPPPLLSGAEHSASQLGLGF